MAWAPAIAAAVLLALVIAARLTRRPRRRRLSIVFRWDDDGVQADDEQ